MQDNCKLIVPWNIITGVSPTRTGVNIYAAPAAPKTQSFFDPATAKVANLVATGTGIKWYAAATGGLPLASTVQLSSGTYYVSQAIGDCESGRNAISVTVTPTSVVYCKGAVATPLSAGLNGTSLKWYTVATGGTAAAVAPKPVTTAVTTTPVTTSYWVSQVVNGVESPRLQINVTVNPTPGVPVAITGVPAQGALVGTHTTAPYSIATVADASSYAWTVNGGAAIVGATNGLAVNVDFFGVPAGAGAIGNLSVVSKNGFGCSSAVKTLALTKALPLAPAAIKMTNDAVSTTVAVTSFAKYMGTTTPLTLTATAVGASYIWELPVGVNMLTGATLVTPATDTTVGVYTSTGNAISVNFNGVTAANTFNYSTTAVVPVSTNVLNWC